MDRRGFHFLSNIRRKKRGTVIILTDAEKAFPLKSTGK